MDKSRYVILNFVRDNSFRKNFISKWWWILLQKESTHCIIKRMIFDYKPFFYTHKLHKMYNVCSIQFRRFPFNFWIIHYFSTSWNQIFVQNLASYISLSPTKTTKRNSFLDSNRNDTSYDPKTSRSYSTLQWYNVNSNNVMSLARNSPFTTRSSRQQLLPPRNLIFLIIQHVLPLWTLRIVWIRSIETLPRGRACSI